MKTGFSAGIRYIQSQLLSYTSRLYCHNTAGIYDLSGGFSNFRKDDFIQSKFRKQCRYKS